MRTSDVASPDLFVPSTVRRLFDEMSRTYGLVNYVSSFTFCERWRRQCADQIPLRPGETVYDLMCGMGEVWPHVGPRIGATGHIRAIDFSHEMCNKARRAAERMRSCRAEVIELDVLDNTEPDACADAVLSTFGLKTFSDDQKRRLAAEIYRLLKPGGRLSLLEISVPPNRLLRAFYMFYVGRVIPLVGRLMLGNPDNYRMLGVYTRSFGDCRRMAELLAARGLEVELRSFFFGCATGLVGRKPAE